MNKKVAVEVTRYKALLESPRGHATAQYAANALAVLQRSATTKKTFDEITAVIFDTGAYRYLQWVDNNCFIPRY